MSTATNRGKQRKTKERWLKQKGSQPDRQPAAYFTVGAPNKYIRPQSAIPSENPVIEEKTRSPRPNTAPSSKPQPYQPSDSERKEKSHFTPSSKEDDKDSNLDLFTFSLNTCTHSKDRERNSHGIFPFNKSDDGNTPVFDVPKEAWSTTCDISTVVVTAPKTPPPQPKLSKELSFEAWLTGPDIASDEYDTDLEDDFPKELEMPIDPTGKYIYVEECKKQGVLPVSYITRHLCDRHLVMKHHYLGGRRTAPIAEALKSNTVTETLDLTDNYIEGEGAYCLADMINTNFFIVSLNLSNNFLRSEGAEAMSRMLQTNTTLKHLSLSGNQLTDMDCHLITEALKNNTTLTSIDLSHNEIGELGGMWMAAALAVNEGLLELDVSWNAIRQKGGVSLGVALLRNCCLEVLDISWNGLGAHGVLGLAKGLKGNSKLKVLDLANNHLDKNTITTLCTALRKNSGLQYLVLNQNPITESGLNVLLKAVAVHPTLKFLSVEEVVVSPSLFEKIQELREKKSVIVIHGDGYHTFTPDRSVMKLFNCFLRDNHTVLERNLREQDRGSEGVVSLDELKTAFKQSGLSLTNKQLDVLVESSSLLRNGFIDYSGLLDWSLIKGAVSQRV